MLLLPLLLPLLRHPQRLSQQHPCTPFLPLLLLLQRPLKKPPQFLPLSPCRLWLWPLHPSGPSQPRLPGRPGPLSRLKKAFPVERTSHRLSKCQVEREVKWRQVVDQLELRLGQEWEPEQEAEEHTWQDKPGRQLVGGSLALGNLVEETLVGNMGRSRDGKREASYRDL